MKFSRKIREKIFKLLPKTEKAGIRKDKFGNEISFHEFGKKSPYGWLIEDNQAIFWRMSECCNT